MNKVFGVRGRPDSLDSPNFRQEASVNKIRRITAIACMLSALAIVAPATTVSPAGAQETTAAVNGTITDPSGAPIVGATVTAIDTARGTAYPTQTNTYGAYYLPRIPIGNYQVKVEAKGFQTAVHSAFDLVLDQVARVDMQLTVGSMSQTVEVTGAAPLLQTETTTNSPFSLRERQVRIRGPLLPVKTRFKSDVPTSTVTASRPTITSSTA